MVQSWLKVLDELDNSHRLIDANEKISSYNGNTSYNPEISASKVVTFPIKERHVYFLILNLGNHKGRGYSSAVSEVSAVILAPGFP